MVAPGVFFFLFFFLKRLNGLHARASWKKFPTLRMYIADLLDSDFPEKGS